MSDGGQVPITLHRGGQPSIPVIPCRVGGGERSTCQSIRNVPRTCHTAMRPSHRFGLITLRAVRPPHPRVSTASSPGDPLQGERPRTSPAYSSFPVACPQRRWPSSSPRAAFSAVSTAHRVPAQDGARGYRNGLGSDACRRLARGPALRVAAFKPHRLRSGTAGHPTLSQASQSRCGAVAAIQLADEHHVQGVGHVLVLC